MLRTAMISLAAVLLITATAARAEEKKVSIDDWPEFAKKAYEEPKVAKVNAVAHANEAASHSAPECDEKWLHSRPRGRLTRNSTDDPRMKTTEPTETPG